MRHPLRALALCALACAFLVVTVPAQLVVNGDMDGPIGFDILPPGWDQDLASSNTFGPGPVGFFQMEWATSANGGTFAHSTGIVRMGLQSEGLSQVVSGLIPGASYTLSFEQSTSFFNSFSVDTHGYWAVEFGGQTQDSALVPHPTLGNTQPWQTESMQFTATASTQLLRFRSRSPNGLPTNFLIGCMGVDGVSLCLTGTCGAPGMWLYTVDDANVLRVVDADGCSVATIGLTKDSPGPVRRIRGLAYVPIQDALYGMTREGDLVKIDRFTGKTSLGLSLPFGNPATEFWSGLAFDGVDTLYTANGYGGHELVAIKVSALTSTLIGSTVDPISGAAHRILGLDVYPSSAILPTTAHPVPGVLYGDSRDTQSVVVIDTNTAAVTPVGGNLGLGAPQAITFHPLSGVLYSLDDHQLLGSDAGLATYDFNALQGSQQCALPFGVIEAGGTPDHGWGGLAFVRAGGWSDQGCALPGVAGNPLLVGGGPLSANSVNTLDLSLAAPNALAGLFISISSTPVPFFGGTLKPVPFLMPLNLFTTSPVGTINLAFLFPPGAPLASPIWFQWAVVDVAAPFGVALSNAVLGLTP